MSVKETQPSAIISTAAAKSAGGFYKAVRILTVPPLLAAALLGLLYAYNPELFGGGLNISLLAVFLAAFPILAYPLQPLIPPFRKQGRRGQRNLAMLMCFTGYISAVTAIACLKGTNAERLISLTYLISGIGIVIFNKLLKVKASGHACGAAGPIVALVFFLGWWWLLAVIILLPVFAASVKTKQHTFKELFFGTLISPVAFATAYLITLFITAVT